MGNWDLIIIGAGPAGLTAGIYAGRAGLKALILEEKTSGGEAAVTPCIENYPGFESISGLELVERMTKQCRKFGAQINELERAISLDLSRNQKLVKTDKRTYSSAAAILATGTHYKHLAVPGEDKFQGRGVSYCAVCDGAFFKDRSVIVVGGGNSAATSAQYLSNVAADVKLVHRRNQLRAEEAHVKALRKENVEFLWNSEVVQIKGEDVVKSVILRNNETGQTNEIRVDGIFVQIGEVPNTSFIRGTGIELDKDGYIIVDARQRTNLPGVFAAGDVTDQRVKQVGTAIGQAVVAATEAFGYIKRPYYYTG